MAKRINTKPRKKKSSKKRGGTHNLTPRQEAQRQQMLRESHIAIGKQKFYEGSGVDDSDFFVY